MILNDSEEQFAINQVETRTYPGKELCPEPLEGQRQFEVSPSEIMMHHIIVLDKILLEVDHARLLPKNNLDFSALSLCCHPRKLVASPT